MEYGTIRARKEAGFGFITPDAGGKDLFFHVKQRARGTDEALLVEGARVCYDFQPGDRGPMAVNVDVTAAPAEPVAEVSMYSEAEAHKGLRDALLAAVEWVDVLETIRQSRRA
jgi:CspA family cold shock protein